MVRTRLNIGCRYSTPVRERPLHPTRGHFTPEPSQTQAPVTPATEPERRAGGSLTTTTVKSALRTTPPSGRYAVSPSEDAPGSSPAPTAGACGPLSCTRSSAPRSSTTSIRRPGSPTSSTTSPTCRRPVCTNSCPGPGRRTGSRPWPRNLRPLAARQLPTTTPPANRRSPKSWRMQPTGGAIFTGGVRYS